MSVVHRAGQCDPAIMAAKLQLMGWGCAVQSIILADCSAGMFKVVVGVPELRRVGGAAVFLLWCSRPVGKMSVPHEHKEHCHIRPQMPAVAAA